jgi:predicted PurR-regulated permease PerM
MRVVQGRVIRTMEQKAESGLDNEKDILDRTTDNIRCRSELEPLLENRQNTLVQRHPHLVGYAFLFGLVLAFSLSHLMMFIMSFLFLYLISDFMTNDVHRRVPLVPRALLFSLLYVVVVSLIVVLAYKVLPGIARTLPDLANQLQTQTVNEIKRANQVWNLTQYVDINEIRGALIQASTGFLRYLVDNLPPLYKGFIQLIFAMVINVFLYHDMARITHVFDRQPGSLMSFLYRFTEVRLRIFYFYFKRVMGGQFIISAINTAISSVVIIALGLRHPYIMISIVFLCGLFPIVGNLVSNSVLVITAFVSIGLWGAGICLILLIVIHKLEYFLNSKIIGGMVRLPMTVSLAALIFFEVLLGIPGLILAIPLTLFARHELEHIPGFPTGSCS